MAKKPMVVEITETRNKVTMKVTTTNEVYISSLDNPPGFSSVATGNVNVHIFTRDLGSADLDNEVKKAIQEWVEKKIISISSKSLQEGTKIEIERLPKVKVTGDKKKAAANLH